MLAPATAAPLESVTSPVICPFEDCANPLRLTARKPKRVKQSSTLNMEAYLSVFARYIVPSSRYSLRNCSFCQPHGGWTRQVLQVSDGSRLRIYLRKRFSYRLNSRLSEVSVFPAVPFWALRFEAAGRTGHLSIPVSFRMANGFPAKLCVLRPIRNGRANRSRKRTPRCWTQTKPGCASEFGR